MLVYLLVLVAIIIVIQEASIPSTLETAIRQATILLLYKF